MLCKKPYMMGCLPYGCGQCTPCRINRRRLWTHRMILESYMHSKSSFVTLTYAEKSLPTGASLVKKDLRDFLKRLRKEISPQRIRYYAVGEYGERTMRPHYHLALFGLGMEDANIIEKAWGKGHVVVGDLNPNSAQYIVGYVTKGMTKKEDKRLCGKSPEFATMSLHPGIGATSLSVIVKSLESCPSVMGSVKSSGLIPTILQHGRKKLPLGRYLRRKLRECLHISEEDAKAKGQTEYALQMREVFKDAFADKENAALPLSAILVKRDGQKILNTEVRFKIFNKKGEL